MADIIEQVWNVNITDDAYEVNLQTEIVYQVELTTAAQGPPGESGSGVPAGGLTGQHLYKISDADGDAGWEDPPASAVTSVNSQTGAVVLDSDDVDEGVSNLYYTDARVIANATVAANTAARHSHANKAVLDLITTAGSGEIITVAERAKLGGIEAGAQVNTVITVNSQTGTVVLDYTHVGAAPTVHTHSQYLTDAPSDGNPYGRQDGAWVIVGTGSGAVDSVNGQTGVVVLDTDDISEGATNLYYTEVRVSANTDVAANTAARHSHANKAVLDLITAAGSGIIISAAERTKLDGIEAGAQVNTVDSVNGLTGVVVLDTDDVAEGAVNLYYTEGRVTAHPDVADNTSFRNETYPFFWGCSVESTSVSVASDGATITLTLDNAANPGTDIAYEFESDVLVAMPSTITLTAGTDTDPVLNYIWLDNTGTLMMSTTAWPSGPFAPVATVVCQSAASLQTDGALKVHNWNNHIYEDGGNGHLMHLNFWIRQQHATWLTGGVPSLSIVSGSPDEVYFSCTSGTALQLHINAFPTMDQALGDPVYVINHPTTPYRRTLDLADLAEDSNGGTLSNRYFSLVFFAVVNSNDTVQVLCNLPDGSYGNASDAISDVDGYDNFILPVNFRGTGILLARAVLDRNPGGSYTLVQLDDLRGNLIGTVAGGGGGVAGASFSDGEFSIFNSSDATKIMALDLSGLTTGNVRTLGVQDASGTIAYLADIPTSHTELTDIGTNTHVQIDSHIANTSNPHGVTAEQLGLAAEAYGFPNRTDSDISFTDGTRTFQIAPAVTSFDVWVAGTKYTISSAQTTVIPDSRGWHFIYFDTSGVLQNTTDAEMAVLNNTLVAKVYWESVGNASVSLSDRRHGIGITREALYYHETVVGPRAITHITPNSVNDLGGSLDSDAQVGVDSGSMLFGDLQTDWSFAVEPVQIPVIYRDNAVGDGWVMDAATNFPVKTAGSGRLAVNAYQGGWGQDEVNSGGYLLCHIMLTTDPNNPLVAVQGMQEYASLTAAKQAVGTELDWIFNDVLGGGAGDGLPVEGVFLFTLYYQTDDSFTNTVKGSTVWISSTDKYFNWVLLERENILSHQQLRDIGVYSHVDIDAFMGGAKIQEDSGDGLMKADADLYTQYTIYSDTIGEFTADAGVTIDGLLIKDGGITIYDDHVADMNNPHGVSVSGIDLGTFKSGTRQLIVPTDTLLISGAGNLYIGSQNSDHRIYFYTGSYWTNEWLMWDQSETRFEFSDELRVNGPVTTNTIQEDTADSGVTIDGLLIKDGAISVYDLYLGPANVYKIDGQGVTTEYTASADTNAARGTALQTALTAASSGDVLVVRPGTFDTNLLMKDGVHLHFQPGAEVVYTGSTTGAIFSDEGSAITMTVTGKGVFRHSGTTGNRQVVNLTNGASELTIHADTLYSTNSVGIRVAGVGSGFCRCYCDTIWSSGGSLDNVSSAMTIEVFARYIYSANGFGIEQNGGYTNVYDAYINAPNAAPIEYSSGAGIYCRNVTLDATGEGSGEACVNALLASAGIVKLDYCVLRTDDMTNDAYGNVTMFGCRRHDGGRPVGSGITFSGLDGDFVAHEALTAEHIDWTGTTEDLVTTGSVSCGSLILTSSTNRTKTYNATDIRNNNVWTGTSAWQNQGGDNSYLHSPGTVGTDWLVVPFHLPDDWDTGTPITIDLGFAMSSGTPTTGTVDIDFQVVAHSYNESGGGDEYNYLGREYSNARAAAWTEVDVDAASQTYVKYSGIVISSDGTINSAALSPGDVILIQFQFQNGTTTPMTSTVAHVSLVNVHYKADSYEQS